MPMSFLSRLPRAQLLRQTQSIRHASTVVQTESAVGNSIRRGAYTTVFVVGTTLFAIYYADSRSAVHRWVIPPLSRTFLDAETAHKFALAVLRSGLGPRDQYEDDERLKVELWDQVLSNPVGLAAGFDKDGEAVNGLFNLGFGWVEIGSVTPRPQPGNARPRVFHLPDDSAVINRYGFPSKGSISVLTRLQARYQTHTVDSPTTNASLRPGQLLSVNLGKNKSSPPDSISDFLTGVEKFGALADVLVINVSSPNTPGLRNLQSRGMLIELLSAVKRERDGLELDRPLPKLLVKIAPDLSKEELMDIAEAVRETGVDGVIVSNTTIQRPSDLKSNSKAETGGLSGPPLKPITLKALKTLRPLLPVSIPIIGCGGITTGADALEYAKAGASTVQLYTSLTYGGAGAPRRVKDEITALLRASNQTWMDVVREGQKSALQEKPDTRDIVAEVEIAVAQEKPFSLDEKAIKEEIHGSLKEGAKAFEAMGKQLMDIIKEAPQEPSDKIQ